jgi:hypothetical protein
MLEPDVTLTDYALAVECAVFAALLFRRAGARGDGGTVAYFGAVFACLSAASVLGGTYHGFFSGSRSPLADALWLLTLLSIGAAGCFIWLAAAFQLTGQGRRVVGWVAAVQFLVFAIYVIAVSRNFLIASVNMVPPMVFLLAGYVRMYLQVGGKWARRGLIGLAIAFMGALLQSMKIGLHPDYFNHNAVYHVMQFAAFALIFASIPGIARRGT